MCMYTYATVLDNALAIMNTPTNHTPTPLEYFSKNTAHVHINLVNWNVAVPWGMRTDRLQEKKNNELVDKLVVVTTGWLPWLQGI